MMLREVVIIQLDVILRRVALNLKKAAVVTEKTPLQDVVFKGNFPSVVTVYKGMLKYEAYRDSSSSAVYCVEPAY